MNNYIQNGDNYRIIPGAHVHTDLPVDTYEAAFDPQTGDSWLVRKPGMADEINVTTKIYGNAEAIAEHAIDAWKRRQKHTGVLLSGVYGSGKTITAQLIANNALQGEQVPVVYVGVECVTIPVLKMLGNITTRCVIIFDELDKCGQEDPFSSRVCSLEANLLYLLDGCTLNDHLYIITANHINRLPNGLLNRPGRVLYHWIHGYLDSEEIREVCEDRGVAEQHIKSMCKLNSVAPVLTYDTLNALITECKEFYMDPVEAFSYLNICTTREDNCACMYDLTFIHNGVTYPSGSVCLDVTGVRSDDLYLPTTISEQINVYHIPLRNRSLIHAVMEDGSIDFTDPGTGVRVIAKPRFQENILTHKSIWGE